MNTKERSIWIIDRSYKALIRFHSWIYAIWVFYVLLTAFQVSGYITGMLSMEWHTTPLTVLVGIWFTVVSLRPELVLIWNCKKLGKLDPAAYPYLEKMARTMAWELKGRHFAPKGL
ncbi:MAG: hypothetical protein OXI44_11450 [Bacteroidota bacterium]|nr:hypothetical protein [Bacteroidota bacterium]